MTEPTPGPWVFGNTALWAGKGQTEEAIASVDSDYCFVWKREIDRRVAEAAPDMLAALEMAARQLGEVSGNSTILEVLKVGPLARTIDRAIAKARTP